MLLVLCTMGLCSPSEAAVASTRPPLPEGAVTSARPPPPVWLEGLKNGCASGLAVVASKTLLQPFDTLKTLQQAAAGSPSHVGLRAVTSKLVSEHGFLALYRGLGISLFGAVPSMSAYFAVYQSSKALLLSRVSIAPPLLLIAFSSAVANTIAATLRVPCEVVKQRLQAGVYPSLISAFTTLNAGGLAAWIPRDAWLAQIARDIPFGVFMFITYESLTRTLEDIRSARVELAQTVGQGGSSSREGKVKGTGKGTDALLSSACGMAAGAIATILTNPMDVLKTRVMVGTPNAAGAGLASYVRCASEIWRNEGPFGFSRGALPRLLHKVPASGLFWLLYTAFSQLLGATSTTARTMKR